MLNHLHGERMDITASDDGVIKMQEQSTARSLGSSVGRLGNRVYWIFRAAFWDEFDVCRVSGSAASNLRERATILLLVLRLIAVRALVICHILPRRLYETDVNIRLQRAQYTVGLRTYEVVVFDEIYREHVYDKLTDFISQPGWTVLDIGANVGAFTIQQAQRGARVFAFEPNPDCYRRLVKAITANRLVGAVHALNFAVSRTPGAGYLKKSDTHSHLTVLGSVVTAADEASGVADTDVLSTRLAVTSLDAMVPALGITHIHLLKIDTEGAELTVLQGSAATLKLVDRVVLEYHSPQLREQVCALLEQSGFTIALASKDSAATGILYARKLPTADTV